MSWILAIDTAGAEGCVTLAPVREPDRFREFPLNVRLRHAQVLLPAIRQALNASGLRATDVSVVAVTTGPGSFTGLRVGVMAAKTWAYATGAKLVAVPSLVAIAETWRADHRPGTSEPTQRIWIIENAQRGELFVSGFSADPAEPVAFDATILIQSPTDLLAHMADTDRIVGPGVGLWTEPDGSLLDDLSPDVLGSLLAVSDRLNRPTGEVLARLAAERVLAEQYDSPQTLEPLYLRRSSAEDKWLARQAGA